MITDQDADKIASMVFDRLVARWDARNDVLRRKKIRPQERKMASRKSKEVAIQLSGSAWLRHLNWRTS
jgi:hypothetical protein